MKTARRTKAFIVDDNNEAIELLRRRLEGGYALDVVGTAGDAEHAADLIVKTEPDLLFLDIELPTMTGLEFYSLIRSELKPETKVVFYTGYDKYMLEALRKQAFDYLLKPATEQDVAQLMTRFYENRLENLQQPLDVSYHLPIILVLDIKNEHVTLRLDEIAYFCYNQDRKIWEIICLDGTTYVLRHRTTAEVILNYSADLVQIHKRFIVNINHVKMIQGAECLIETSYDEEVRLHISKNYRADFMRVFYSL